MSGNMRQIEGVDAARGAQRVPDRAASSARASIARREVPAPEMDSVRASRLEPPFGRRHHVARAFDTAVDPLTLIWSRTWQRSDFDNF